MPAARKITARSPASATSSRSDPQIRSQQENGRVPAFPRRRACTCRGKPTEKGNMMSEQNMPERDPDYVCEDYGDVKAWTQIRVTVPLEQLDTLTALMSMISNNLMIEDYSDIETNLRTCYGDLIDEKILNADRTVASVSVYVPSDRSYADDVAFLRDRMAADGLTGKLELVGVNEEDWANNWKRYYKPLKIGNRIVICPAWEAYTPTGNELVVRMDPGMAFGTGTHETTRLMIRLLEDYTQPGCRMLDVGTGTGILAICASRLGAGVCRAYDIDPTAVRVARENIRESGLTNITCDRSDLLRQVDLRDGRYDLITANIVADILIRMMPDVGAYLAPDGVLLLSGIVEERCADVIASADANGYSVETRLPDNGWCALALRRKR
ncbi:MAG: 50S ribosomal protein L11 methyltransferase [Clostridiales bacterium]|nr:50S ribosomal protein L11 methyltransferase [Clostridiales bacterium]